MAQALEPGQRQPLRSSCPDSLLAHHRLHFLPERCHQRPGFRFLVGPDREQPVLVTMPCSPCAPLHAVGIVKTHQAITIQPMQRE